MYFVMRGERPHFKKSGIRVALKSGGRQLVFGCGRRGRPAFASPSLLAHFPSESDREPLCTKMDDHEQQLDKFHIGDVSLEPLTEPSSYLKPYKFLFHSGRWDFWHIGERIENRPQNLQTDFFSMTDDPSAGEARQKIHLL